MPDFRRLNAAVTSMKHARDDRPLNLQVLPLGMLSAGESGTVVDVDGRPDVVIRLQEMGFRPGCHVRMVKPGSACLVAIDNHRFGFRSADAALVLVEVEAAIP